MSLPQLTTRQRREYDELGYTLVPGVFRAAELVSYQEATVEKGNKDQWKVLRPA